MGKSISSIAGVDVQHQPPFRFAYLLPRYWFTWFGLGCLWCLQYLPKSFKQTFANGFGNLVQWSSEKRRKIVEINLRMAFPDLTAWQRAEMLHEYFTSAARVMLDYPLLWWASKKRLQQNICLRGSEQITRCRDKQQPVILLTCHMLPLEFGALALTQMFPGVGLIKPARNRLLEWLITCGRTRFLGQLYTREAGLRPIIRAIKQGRLFYYLPDEDLGETQKSVFVPFFGVSTATLTALARIAKVTGAAVLPTVTYYDYQQRKYVVEVKTPLTDFPQGDELADARHMNQVLETLICQAPSQYMWSLRMFQTRPGSEPSPYPK